MLRFTIAKKINTFTIILVLTCILASSFSIIASIKGINEAETLDEVSLSANLLLTAVKTNVLNVNSDVSKYVITGDQKYIENMQKAIDSDNLAQFKNIVSKNPKMFYDYNQLDEFYSGVEDFAVSSQKVTNSFKLLKDNGDTFLLLLMIYSQLLREYKTELLIVWKIILIEMIKSVFLIFLNFLFYLVKQKSML